MANGAQEKTKVKPVPAPVPGARPILRPHSLEPQDLLRLPNDYDKNVILPTPPSQQRMQHPITQAELVPPPMPPEEVPARSLAMNYAQAKGRYG